MAHSWATSSTTTRYGTYSCCWLINASVCAPQKNIATITALPYRVVSDEPDVYESNKYQVRENEVDMLTVRETEANEWDGVHITGYDTMLPLRNSTAITRTINTIHQINSDALQTTTNSHL